MKLIGHYKNGDFYTSIFADGTKIRATKDDNAAELDFAENIDIKITNKCSGTNCKFCHEGSGPAGKSSDILNLRFLDSLHPFQEVALGGGNILEYPDLIPLLEKLKEKNVITNITINQIHFEKNIELLQEIFEKKLVYGIGVSLISPTSKFIDLLSSLSENFRKALVIHVINGIVIPDELYSLNGFNLRLLILGYKKLRRGENYYSEMEQEIVDKQAKLKEEIFDRKIALFSVFSTISFDNLAIEQLDIKNLISEEEWNMYYMGDEGTTTFYIDCVEKKFAKNSTAPQEERYELLDSVDAMFDFIKSKTKEEA